MKPPMFGARLAKASTRMSTPADPNATQPLSCFSLEPVCEVLAQELEQVLEREHQLATAEQGAGASEDLAAQPQPNAVLVEPAGR